MIRDLWWNSPLAYQFFLEKLLSILLLKLQYITILSLLSLSFKSFKCFWRFFVLEGFPPYYQVSSSFLRVFTGFQIFLMISTLPISIQDFLAFRGFSQYLKIFDISQGCRIESLPKIYIYIFSCVGTEAPWDPLIKEVEERKNYIVLIREIIMANLGYQVLLIICCIIQRIIFVS